MIATAALPDTDALQAAANKAIAEVDKARSAPTERIEQDQASLIEDIEANELGVDKFDAD